MKKQCKTWFITMLLRKNTQKKQKEFAAEYLYSDPNNYNEMVELYTAYGYKYSRSLWAYQQAIFQQAEEQTKKRLQKTNTSK